MWRRNRTTDTRRNDDPDYLLDEYDFLVDYPRELKRIRRYRRRCTLNGHIYEFVNIPAPNRYTIMCVRCFPHIDSLRTIASYNPFLNTSKVD